MKFIVTYIWEPGIAAEISKFDDKIAAAPPPGYKELAHYICLGKPFDGIPPGKAVTFQLVEADSAEVMAAVWYPMMLLGANVNYVPVIDAPVGNMTELEKQSKGLMS